MPLEYRYTLPGAPRTKKTSNRLVWAGKRQIILPSKAWATWCRNVRRALGPCFTLPDRPYNCQALVYRDALRGDAVGYYQGIADVLESLKVVSNDKWILTWDGSELLVDRANPRVELILTPID